MTMASARQDMLSLHAGAWLKLYPQHLLQGCGQLEKES